LAGIADVPDGTLIAYSTAADVTADDGSGDNSPYTQNLVAVLRSRPAGGLELIEVFREASREVKRQTGQRPWLNLDASLDKFYLWRGDGSQAASSPVGSLERPAMPNPQRVPRADKTIINSIGMEFRKS
jgi:uncharacterized caspase-like protein